jgi:hypothetical protein
VAILSDPDRFYGVVGPEWSLGDLVLVPVAVLWETSEVQTSAHPQPAPPADASRSVLYDAWTGGLPNLPSPAVELALSPAVIVADDCALDKEFNIVVRDLVEKGADEDTAIEIARGTELDPIVPVCPLRPYAVLRYANAAAVRTANVVGYFPLPPKTSVTDEGYLDFVRTVPVSRRLLTGPLAVMSADARRILRWKLAEFYAYRNLSTDATVMSVKGRTITDVQVVADSKNRLVISMHLDGPPGELLLKQEPRTREEVEGASRGR